MIATGSGARLVYLHKDERDSGLTDAAGAKAGDDMYCRRLERNWRMAMLSFALGLSRSMPEKMSEPEPTFASNTEARRRLLAKLSTCPTIGVAPAISLMLSVLEFFMACHHCQLVWLSVGKCLNASWFGSQNMPIVPA